MIKAVTTFRRTLIYTIVVLSILRSTLKTVTAAIRTQEELAHIYQMYDVEEDEAPTCPERSELSNDNLCPSDEGATSIGRIETITQFCTDNLSYETVIESQTIQPNSRRNAVEGCKKFVGCYIVRNRQKIPTQYACCPSDRCNKFLGEQYVKMGILWDDDDDDMIHEEEDDDGDDGVLAREAAAVSTDL